MALELSSRQHADGVSLEQESVLEKLRNTGLISSKQGNEYAQFVEGRKFLVTAARPMQEQERDDLSVFSMVRVEYVHDFRGALPLTLSKVTTVSRLSSLACTISILWT